MSITEAQQETIDWIQARHADAKFEETIDWIQARHADAKFEKLADQNVVVATYQQEHSTGADLWWIVCIYPDGLVSAKSLQS